MKPVTASERPDTQRDEKKEVDETGKSEHRRTRPNDAIPGESSDRLIVKARPAVPSMFVRSADGPNTIDLSAGASSSKDEVIFGGPSLVPEEDERCLRVEQPD